MKKTALNELMATKAEIDDLLKKLMIHSDEHFGATPDAVNWGDVGSACYIREQLKAACEHANIK